MKAKNLKKPDKYLQNKSLDELMAQNKFIQLKQFQLICLRGGEGEEGSIIPLDDPPSEGGGSGKGHGGGGGGSW